MFFFFLKLDTYHFRWDFTDDTRYWFSRSTIVRHFKFYGISNFQMLNVTTELAEVKEQPCLSFTALNKSIRVLLMLKKKIVWLDVKMRCKCKMHKKNSILNIYQRRILPKAFQWFQFHVCPDSWTDRIGKKNYLSSLALLNYSQFLLNQ